jgi:peptidylprolyl isomerase
VKIQNSADFEKEQEQIRKLEEETQEKMKKIESETIGKYVKDNNIRVKPLESGMYFIPKKLGRGPKADIGEFVEVHYSAETLEGEKLFSSHSGKDESITFEMGSGFAIPGVEEGLKMMNAGSTARLIVPFSMAYGAKGLKNVVQPYCPLIYDLELISIMDSTVYKTKMETLEEEKIAKYLKENNITTAPDQYGLYYIELKKGNGRAGAEGKTVKINYTGKLLDGSVLHSSSENGSPVEFKVGEGEVIQGWDIAMTYMKQGGRAKLIIPSKLAFGDGYTGIVAPYTPLVYEIELLSVK